MDHPGLIARSVQDLALAFSVLAGPDPRDPTTLQEPAPLADLQLESVRPPRIGVVREFFFDRTLPEMWAALERQVAALESAGATVTEVGLPDLFSVHAEAHRLVMNPEAAVVHSARYGRRRDDLTPRHRAMIEAASLLPATYYLQAQRVRRALWEQLAALFESVDILVMPTAPGPAPVGLESTGDASLLSPWSFVGFPASSISAGLSSDGLPMGLQLVGPPNGDGDLLRTSAWAERILGVLPPPPLFA
jgi:aspartyl-tRNA(Asn)/glutamyl-tRNA(Gln) amidotransferase subunit A